MARGSKRKKPSRKTSKDDSDDSSYSISQSIPSEEEPLKEDEEEDVSSQDSQGDEYEEVFHDGELEDLEEIFPHEELSTIPEGAEVSANDDTASLSARKAEFYKAVDDKIFSMSKLNKHAHIISDALFDQVYKPMLAIQDAGEEDRLKEIRKLPNKVGYKWVKKYAIKTVDTSNILIFKQGEGEALDTCQKVVSYSKIFDVLRQIHELDAGNDHPKAKTLLFKRATAKYGKSIPRWVCEMFPKFCPVCIRSRPWKKASWTSTFAHLWYECQSSD